MSTYPPTCKKVAGYGLLGAGGSKVKKQEFDGQETDPELGA